MFLLSTALAFDQCPDPQRPHITDFVVVCEQDLLTLFVTAQDDGAPPDSARVTVWSPDGTELSEHPLVLHKVDTADNGEPQHHFWSATGQAIDCAASWLLRAEVTNISGQVGQRDRWLNSPYAILNGGFEEDLWGWGVGGNAEVGWKDYSAQPTDPYQGQAMLEIGWPGNASMPWGYAWQALGELPPGDYGIELKYSIVTDLHHVVEDGVCNDRAHAPGFYVGFNGYGADEVFDPFAFSEESLYEVCDQVVVDSSGWWGVTPWMSWEDTLTVPDSQQGQDTFLWMSVSGGYAQWGHWVLVDEVYVTPPQTTTDWEAEASRDEPWRLDEKTDQNPDGQLTWPVDVPDLEDWNYWDHFEQAVNLAILDDCPGCASMRGKYGPPKTTPEHDVDGTWGFDGSFHFKGDGSVLLVETKSTGTRCFDDDDDGLQQARSYLDQRRKESASPLKKCESIECEQMSGLWIAGTIQDLCDDPDDQRRLAAVRIDEAWEEGKLSTTWAAVGFQPENGCMGGWVLEAEPAPPRPRDEPICTREYE